MRMASIRRLLSEERDVLEAVLWTLVEHPIGPGRSPSVDNQDKTFQNQHTIIFKSYLLHVVLGRAVLKLERGRKGGQPFVELGERFALRAHHHQLVHFDEFGQPISFYHAANLFGRQRFLLGQPKVEVAEPKYVAKVI